MSIANASRLMLRLMAELTKRDAVGYRGSRMIDAQPLGSRMEMMKLVFVSTASMGAGALIAHTVASYLEDSGWAPKDDDDDDD